MSSAYTFSSESVGEGHPDKVADYISDTILDACLEDDPASRVACETLVKSNHVTLAGEVTTGAILNLERLVRDAIRTIGYSNEGDLFHADSVSIANQLTEQSRDIAQGVDAVAAEGKLTSEQGAGDQGIMFGFACDETEELMPAAITYAHRLTRELARLRHTEAVRWLRPDSKSQVAVRYEHDRPVQIESVVISTQHSSDIDHATVRDLCVEKLIPSALPGNLLSPETQYLINPTGRFVNGGPEGDAGLTGRKIIVDTYGGAARHGGGAFSGKDPTKVDRSAAYMCRWVAKNIVAAGLARRAELQIAYAIGYPEPTSMHLETFGTGRQPEAAIIEAVRRVFSFKPAQIIDQLALCRPMYKKTTLYGHFGKPDLPWEQTDRTEALIDALPQAVFQST